MRGESELTLLSGHGLRCQHLCVVEHRRHLQVQTSPWRVRAQAHEDERQSVPATRELNRAKLLSMTDGNLADVHGYEQLPEETKATARKIFPDMKA